MNWQQGRAPGTPDWACPEGLSLLCGAGRLFVWPKLLLGKAFWGRLLLEWACPDVSTSDIALQSHSLLVSLYLALAKVQISSWHSHTHLMR